MRKGITQQIKYFFFRYPHSSAEQCCKMLGLNSDKYKPMCYRIKSETKKWLNSKVQGRVHRLHPVRHREVFKFEFPDKLPKGVVDSVVFEASKRRPRKGDPKPFDEWYVIPNKNRMMLLHNDYITIRVWRNGTCRVLPAKPMPFDWVKTAVWDALFKAGVHSKICN